MDKYAVLRKQVATLQNRCGIELAGPDQLAIMQNALKTIMAMLDVADAMAAELDRLEASEDGDLDQKP